MRYWVDDIIIESAQIPHVSQFHRGYRIFIKGVNLMCESDGRLWVSKQLQKGDEVVSLQMSMKEMLTIG